MATNVYIDGTWVPASGGVIPTCDPATEELLEEVGFADASDVDAAVAAARRAFEDRQWRSMPPVQRARLLFDLADLIEAHAEELAVLETRDQGQPVGISRAVSVTGAAEHFRYYAGWVTKIEGATSPVSFPDTLHYTRREPVGVCALITPWNFPLMILAWKLAPALATGNTVIIKPAEQTPLTSIRLVQLAERVGFPPGVINLVTGDGSTGAALAEHPDVDKVSFTGSTEVGRSIVRASAGNLKRVTLELGGKAPSIIAADADIDAAVAGNIAGSVLNSGQVCAAYTRFYVDRKREDEFVAKLADGVSGMRLGPGLDESTQLGPLVSAEHLRSVEQLVATGPAEGAELVTGGRRAADKGWFFQPTVFAGVKDGMTIATKEIFGPVLSVLSYDDEDELAAVIARANQTEYGLAATVWTKDLTVANRVAEGIRAGAIFINMPSIPDMAAPWGGFKASGWGREMGSLAIDAYTEVKAVWCHYGS
ncbi:putative aldehyde dehydrogenase DhaS [Sphaerisporangium krabiense]|uniref:Aldehyde dehydrogenase (NAD+) n=1 Tax=Sphaerisporangium krabiense TaxID=763782 RepID=A0A7W8Z1U0_9ACTN|nr:aldehyde dehydrogenase family protein [Sphaerisporangium krabiense]MBB5625906.1 aldehyde dehydrogenase (NAD+) [Sphaerisporangium krabiense]GII64709.1 putative aldehyde dehydrogenase DhaS [Sphaerisporangium krabiense]